MVDWLLLWGATQAIGVLVYPILQDLAKEGAKDFTKDFFKDSLKHVVLREKDPRNIAAGKAIKEFLQLVQQELKDADVSEAQLQQYTQPLKEFISDKSVKESLGSAFKDDCQALDPKTLAKTWYQLNLLPSLPEEFDWELVGKLYRKKVKAIIRELPELRTVLDSENLESIQQNTKESAGIVPEFDLRIYQEGLQKRYGNLNLDLDGLSTTGYDYRERLKVLQVFIAQNVRECQEYLPQVYEIPKEHQKRRRNSNQLETKVDLEEGERNKKVYYQQPICSVLDVVNNPKNFPYIVILGHPGSGKSTLLQYITLNWAITPLNNPIELPIPLLIELRKYKRDRLSGQCQDFLEFFHKGNVICHLNQHQLNERLKAGKVLVMFDGLDEVFDPAQRKEIITDIHRFTNDYPKVQVIVTSRIIGYKHQWLRDAEFRHFMLQDLESDQIQDFLNQWHKLTFTDEADKVRKRERLQQAIKTSSAIEQLAENPLLLTIMAILNRNQELPRDRPVLYNQASRILLHQWDFDAKEALVEDERLDPKTIDYEDKQAMLRQVAYHMQSDEKGLAGNLISAGDLEKILTDYLNSIDVSQARAVAKLMIRQLRSRSFILGKQEGDSYAFIHGTFLEYFCAWEFVWRFEKERSLSLEELKTEVFGKHWWDDSWHEVLSLITGMLNEKFAGELIDYLIELHEEDEDYLDPDDLTQILLRRLSLAANCLLEVNNRSAIVSIDSRLLQKLKDLIEYLVEQYAYITMHKEPKESNEVYESLTQAVSVVATTWKKHPETLVWLKKIAQSGYYSKSHDAPYIAVEATAVRELAQGWKDAPEILPMLKALAQSENEDDRAAQVTAIQELAQGWKDAPEILPMLKALAQFENKEDRDRAAQVAAIQELAQGWKDDLETLPILKTFIQSSTNGWAKAKVVRELVQGWKDNPDTLSILKTLAQSSKDWQVQNIVVEELARGWKDDRDTLSSLKTCVQHDSSDFIREKVMNELIQNWQASSDIYDFLHECAVDNSFDGFAYDFSYTEDEDAENTPTENTPARQTSLEAIIKQYPDHPKTLPLLQDRAENDPDEKVREFAKKKLEQLESQK